MHILIPSVWRWTSRLALTVIVAGTVSSCVVVPRRHVGSAVVVAPHPVRVLPIGARPLVVRGERCWIYQGTYYRRHAHGYVVFVP